MSVDILRDSASTRSQQRGGFKGETVYAALLCILQLTEHDNIFLR
ncbi:hypothetical protein [Candidatus Regiella insecticola]|nr:hypothetical protein [Candidatus Regiella insecticola]